MAEQNPQQPVVANDETAGLGERLANFIIEHFPEPVDYGEYGISDYLDDVTSPFIGPIPAVFGTAGGVAQAYVVGGQHLAGLAKYIHEQYGGTDPKVDIDDLLDVKNLVPGGRLTTARTDELNRVVNEINTELLPTPEAPPEAKLLKDAYEKVEQMTRDEWRRLEEKFLGNGGESDGDDTDLNAINPFDPTGAKNGTRSGFTPGQSGWGSGGESGSGGSSDSESDTSSNDPPSGTDESTSDDPPTSDPGSGGQGQGSGQGQGGSGQGQGGSGQGQGGSGQGQGGSDQGGSDGGSQEGNVDSEGANTSTVSGQDEDGNWVYRDENGNWTDENGNPLSEQEAAEWEQAYQDSKKSAEGEGGETGGGVSTTPIDETPPVDPVIQQQLNAELQKLRDARGAGGGGDGATDPGDEDGFDVPSDVTPSDLPDKVEWVGNPTGVDTHFGSGAPSGLPVPGYTSSHGTGVIHNDAPVQTSGPDERAQDTLPAKDFGAGARNTEPPVNEPVGSTPPPELQHVAVEEVPDDISGVSRPAHGGGIDIHGGRYQATPSGGTSEYADGSDGGSSGGASGTGGSVDTGVSPFHPVVAHSQYDDVPDQLTMHDMAG